MPSRFSRTTPVLRIFDIAKAREFYLDYLGFRLDWEHRFEPDLPLYMQVSRDDAVLHLSEHHGDCSPGAKLLLDTTGLRDYHAELAAKGYTYLRPGLETPPWGGLTMTVTDPFSNRIVFTERTDETIGV
ncbi:hypothetical protein IP86_21195 [Rhodopseudomonas sp. AAP120]|jgi:catechol 2,3-dioxygenase-like lactoylglutathione lyase family enzyme|uniref:glyoxalase superfamily protein n=1 Tax=Rhodopseudomonas sp. AAP120 TaxID=1523430 RepID=UPI0006B9F464|nr:glyoxalase superfamily protein [Rhodopseudomonas sp. AAP120]KPF94769.1 hypothetical protein IP86_21195 [Rhodopseudomonas sp. AAP120]